MTPNEFTRRHEQEWKQLEAAIGALSGRRAQEAVTVDQGAFPLLYRRACLHLALARERHYPPALIERLDRLALSGHQMLYSARSRLLGSIAEFAVHGFPSLVRENARIFWFATALFYLPALLMGLLVYFQPETVYSFLDHETVRSMEKMYSKAIEPETGTGREATENFRMFGHYISNNITLGFQCFAFGLLFGLGTLYYLTLNGLFLGAVTAHLIHQESAVRLFQFVIAHGAFELTAIVLCGMAGLMLGRALIAPGRRRRSEALAHAAGPAVKVIYGATAMLLIAAFIEAYWSSGAYLPVTGKFIVGGALWALVAAYFLFMGARREP
jgi:uncharacterized membrane protein SpoIIM required for sporulation